MSAWCKVMGGGDWPIYFERGNLTSRFGRFCIQPLHRGFAKTLIAPMQKALLETLPGPAVSGARVCLKSAIHNESARESLISSQLVTALSELRLTSAACFPLLGKARLSRPRALHIDDLQFSAPVQILAPPRTLPQLQAAESLELDFLVHWGRGSIPMNAASDIELPRGWLRLARRHSPVVQANLHCSLIEFGPLAGGEQLILEITTDGSLAPGDALRRASQHVKRARGTMISSTALPHSILQTATR